MPKAKLTHLVDVLGVQNVGDLHERLERGDDVGLGAHQEKVRVQIYDIIKQASDIPQEEIQETINDIVDNIGQPVVEDDTTRRFREMSEAHAEAKKAGVSSKFQVMTEEADQEVFAMLNNLIEQHHRHLIDSDAKIVLLWELQDSYSNGRVRIGNSQKASSIAGVLANFNFAITLNANKWASMIREQREAELDHRLECCFAEEREVDQQGRTGWFFKMRRPDVQEFISITQRHGTTRFGMSELVQAATSNEPSLFDQQTNQESE
ncbi:MAG: hypothetical protein EBZ69_02195 [Alphaproteobacteria bacterium]|nr:hypothetical protein [Alphaproteobacteria bacterium]